MPPSLHLMFLAVCIRARADVAGQGDSAARTPIRGKICARGRAVAVPWRPRRREERPALTQFAEHLGGEMRAPHARAAVIAPGRASGCGCGSTASRPPGRVVFASLTSTGAEMRPVTTTRHLQSVRIVMIAVELVLSCACAVVLLPMLDECWRMRTSVVQMTAFSWYSFTAVTRLISYLNRDFMPPKIERLHVMAGVALFSVSGALGVDGAWRGGRWEDRELAAAVLALLAALLLMADVAASYSAAAAHAQLDAAAAGPPYCSVRSAASADDAEAADDVPPPPYAVAVATSSCCPAPPR